MCIASIGRKSLLATLTSLAECRLPTDTVLDVVIADDSASGVVEPMLSELSINWPFELKVVTSAAANIAIARNTCLQNATGDYLAFIDDDETADKDWIDSFITLAEDTKADAMFGPVNAIYPPDAVKWICDAKPFVKVTGARGDKVSTGSTCNAFVKKSVIDDFKLSFRPDLGKSGGEDTAFFAQLNRMGGILIASDNAMVYENVPLDRLNINHLRSRYIRGGQTYANLFINGKSPASRIFEYAKTSLKIIILSVIVTLSFIIKKDFALKTAFKLWLNLGKLRSLFNMPLIALY